MAIINRAEDTKNAALALEATFGTAIALSAAYKGLLIDPGSFPSPETIIDYYNADISMREKRSTGLIVDDNVSPKWSIKGRATRETIAAFFASCMQNVTEGATTPFAKVNTFHGTQPDFQSNAGKFFSFFWNAETAGEVELLTSAIASSVKFEIKPEMRGIEGICTFESELIAVKHTAGQTYSGTLSPNPATTQPNYYHGRNFTCSIGGTTLNAFKSATIEIKNNAKPIGNNAAGTYCDTFQIGVPNYEAIITVDGYYNAQTKDLIDNLKAGTVTAFDILTITPSATGTTGFLEFVGQGVLKEALNAVADDVHTVHIVLDCIYSSATEALTVKVDDAVDWTF